MLEIFGTLGPACQDPGLLEKMFLEGMTGIRLNMSHSGLKDSKEMIRHYHQAARRAGVKPELLIDMQGPEIRIGPLSQPLTLKEAESVCLKPMDNPAKAEHICLNPLVNPAQAGHICQNPMDNPAKAGHICQSPMDNPAKAGHICQNPLVNPAQAEPIYQNLLVNPAQAGHICLNPMVNPAQAESTCPSQGVPAQNAHVIPVPEHVLPILEPADHILLDDGKMELAITTLKPHVTAAVIRGGTLMGRKSLKVMGKYPAGPAITPQDKENIRLAKSYGVTALMQPFVTRKEELLEVREELRKNHLEHVRVFAKIENCQGIRQIQEILPYADVIVIARGDLGNDMPLWQLPAAQKGLAEICKLKRKPFLVVTQMLASMAENPVPTRAEVSDIFHAVLDGADAVMATNETAVGKYPVEAIRYLKKTAEEGLKWREAPSMNHPAANS